MAVSSIVVGVDGTDPSWRALAMAIGVGRREQATIHVCYVAHMPVPAVGLGVSLAVIDPDGDTGDLGRSVCSELSEAGASGDFSIRVGDVGHELELLAEACHADLIVVGRSRHPALHLGGVPRRLLNSGRWPVLVVP